MYGRDMTQNLPMTIFSLWSLEKQRWRNVKEKLKSFKYCNIILQITTNISHKIDEIIVVEDIV